MKKIAALLILIAMFVLNSRIASANINDFENYDIQKILCEIAAEDYPHDMNFEDCMEDYKIEEDPQDKNVLNLIFSACQDLGFYVMLSYDKVTKKISEGSVGGDDVCQEESLIH